MCNNHQDFKVSSLYRDSPLSQRLEVDGATWLPTKSHKARNLALVASPNIWIQLFHVERIETPWNWHSCCHISGQFVDKFTQLDLSSHGTCKKCQRKQGFLSFAPRFALIRTLDHKLSVSKGNQLVIQPWDSPNRRVKILHIVSQWAIGRLLVQLGLAKING